MPKMRFVATVDKTEHVIEVDNHGADDGYYTMTLDGVVHEVDAKLLKSNIVTALIDHRSYDVDLQKTGDPNDTLDGRMTVRVRGRELDMEMLDDRRKKMKEAAQSHLAGGGSGRVESPMPGKVLKLLVAEGDTVTEGQGVIVVEAMKMENELKAPCDGVISSIVVAEGETVDSGAPLLTVTAPESE